MNTYRVLVIAFLLNITWFSGQVFAEGSWWETGANLLQALNKDTAEEPTSSEIGKALKQALKVGTKNVVTQLGTADGFHKDPSIHIPLPKELQNIKTMLSRVGMVQLVDDLELKLNRAAEAATPQAQELFLQAITEMSFEDIKTIYEGPENSATTYFQNAMSPALKRKMQPIIADTLTQVGAIQVYDRVMGQYKTFPFVPDVKANLEAYVLEKGVEGIFYYIAIEEASIRKNPAKQTTALLKKVFGIKE